MAEETTFYEDLIDNVTDTSENLKNGDTETRSAEAKIYDMQTKLMLACDQAERDEVFNNRKLELERYKIDEELKLRRETEQRRIEIEESKAKTEQKTMWAKVGIAAAEMAAGIGTGILYLKANLKYGGMIGKDAKKWFEDLKHIKL